MCAICVSAPARIPAAPDIPTSAEAGYPKYLVEGWIAVIGPKGLPAEQVKRINAAFATAFATPEVKEAMAKQGNTINISTPEFAQKHFKDELVKYAAIVKKAGVVPQEGAPRHNDGVDKFKQLETFAAVATKGSLTAAAQAEGVAAAIIGRRIDALEERLGVKLMVRTTRRISLTHEGSAFLEDCQRVLADMANAEASVSAGGVKASGHLRVTAPAGFGRRHVAPLVPRFRELHADVSISLNLSDRVVDLAGEGFDCAVRVGDLPDSSLVSVRLADNRRLCVATPKYLQQRGKPAHPSDLHKFDCLTLSSDASQTRGWAFTIDGELQHLRPGGPLDCSDGQVLHEWCLAGYGIAWRSTWEVDGDIAAGRLVPVLQEFDAPANGIYAVFPQRKHLPLRVRLWVDFLKHHYGQAAYWHTAA